MTSIVDDKRFREAAELDRARFEARCRELLDALTVGPPLIEEAVRYMLLDGGKRLRPILCLWTHDACGGTRRAACMDVACAIESLHTYSLVHDDLPCMDDDDLRRGKPSCHKKFGEAVAVLTGDALLTLCFEILSTMPARWPIEDRAVVEVTRIIARAGGSSGIIGGQVLDIAGDMLETTREMVEIIHRMKTATLISASMEAGAVVAGVSLDARAAVREAGLLAGRAFQIVDDVLDLETDAETLGKTPGKDLRDGKLTFPSVAGIEASKAEARRLVEAAKASVPGAGGEESALLVSLLDFVVRRSA
ncbi:MAG: polyprenyl synthetase family protein [bacterium]